MVADWNRRHRAAGTLASRAWVEVVIRFWRGAWRSRWSPAMSCCVGAGGEAMSEEKPVVPPVPPHLFLPPLVVVSPRRQMDVPDPPGAVGADFDGCVS
jgi:hypothetical protein